MSEYVKLLLASAKSWSPVFEGADDNTESADDGGGEMDISKLNLTPEQQSVFNKVIASEKRKHQSATQKAITELEALKTRANLTAKERTELETRLEALQSELLTKEQLAAREKDRIEKTYKKQVDELTQSVNNWQSRFTESTITRELTDAAATHNAFNPEQIVAILRPTTRLSEELDEEGKPTGHLVPKVEFKDTDKNGKPVTLTLTVPEAVKRMTEIDRFLNLFKGKGFGGMGKEGNVSGKVGDISQYLSDPEAYAKARKEGKLKL